MKRILILAMLTFTATAAAAVTDGTYTQGNSTGSSKGGAGVKMVVTGGKFAIKVLRYRDTCRYGDKVSREWLTFKSGTRAKITGPIDEAGAFKGKYSSNYGTIKVSGTISGTTATIKASDSGPFNPASTVHPNSCKGSHTFSATMATG